MMRPTFHHVVTTSLDAQNEDVDGQLAVLHRRLLRLTRELDCCLLQVDGRVRPSMLREHTMDSYRRGQGLGESLSLA